MAMERPIMNPTFLEEEFPQKRKKTLIDRLQPLFKLLRFAGKILLWDPLAVRRVRALRIEDGTPWQRFCWGLLYRLTFVPVFAALTVTALVYAGTHPRQNANEVDPNSRGIYYEPVTLRTDDGIRLEAWLVPVVEAEQILRDKELALRSNHPAVLLVHDFGHDREQMLPLVRPLHDAGFVVMAVALRGAGASAPAGATFGLLESNDVKAAVAVLRKRPFVDQNRVAIVGVGTGANAGLLAASEDPGIKALVLDHPQQVGNQTLIDHIAPKYPSLNWMRPLCKWAFELSYQVHADDLDMLKYNGLISSRKVLIVDSKLPADFNAHAAKSISRFLSASLLPEDAASVDASK
jgi:pimeloyl-ACP methyl ester carboxylesterase